MKLKQLILSSIAFLLVGCASEPMINLSEENQSIIEEKRQNQDGDQTEGATESTEGEVGESVANEEDTATEDTNILTTFDTSEWVPLEETVQLNLTDYLPNVMYQIKQYSNGATSRVDYPNYLDDALSMMQVEARVDNETPLVSIYSWDDSQITRLLKSTEINPYASHLTEINSQSMQDTELLLQSPLQIGTSWQRDDETTSAITAIFSQAIFPAGELENVIEVTSTHQAGELKEYYAQGEGLVATVEIDETGAITQVWQIQAIYHENRIINTIEVMVPTTDEALVEASEASFAWQTNGDFASAFDSVFKEMGILDDTITVQSVSIDQGVVIIDFSPGVVAVLNSHETSEQAVIASIITTLGNFFNTDQVRLTVNNSGMLPDTLEYPTNGIYQVSTITEPLEEVVESTESIETSESGANASSIDESATTGETQSAGTTANSIQ
ncbi:GerMN domain-containing protein [Aerococcaceae bacterium DSM 111021]|nr:GerMN domain-containing protein [Aerococcaceae bacterium DSM 111021]